MGHLWPTGGHMRGDDTIALPAVGGWQYAAHRDGFIVNRDERGGVCFSSFTSCRMGRSPVLLAGESSTIQLCCGPQFLEDLGPNETATRRVRSVLPHVLHEELTNTAAVPRNRWDQVDLDKWLLAKELKDVRWDTLAEALDEGNLAHRMLCREDVLRILLRHYDDAGPFKGLNAAGILASPLKRRYYEVASVSHIVSTLLAEEKLEGTLDGQAWILPQGADALRGEVRQLEERALGFPDREMRGGVFAPGEDLKAWRQLRLIVQRARRYVWIEDQYLGSDVVDLLGEDLPDGVPLRVLGPASPNRFWKGALASLSRLGRQIAEQLEVRTSSETHGRYLYVDGEVWLCSESLKDMTKKSATTIAQQREAESRKLGEDFERRWARAATAFPT